MTNADKIWKKWVAEAKKKKKSQTKPTNSARGNATPKATAKHGEVLKGPIQHAVGKNGAKKWRYPGGKWRYDAMPAQRISAAPTQTQQNVKKHVGGIVAWGLAANKFFHKTQDVAVIDPPKNGIVLFSGGSTVSHAASAMLVAAEGRHLSVHTIGTLRPERGKGHASNLYDRAIELAKSKGLRLRSAYSRTKETEKRWSRWVTQGKARLVRSGNHSYYEMLS